MDNSETSSGSTAIVGGGPAGSITALCLRKLGREVEIFEKARFPRYRIGESLLPGTLSILKRLGVYDRIAAAGFVKKRAATFLWGSGRPPLTFTFATPKTAPWVFDHGLQVNRAEYDQILLDAAKEAGAIVHEECEVTEVDPGEAGGPAEVAYRSAEGAGRKAFEYVVDASGAAGVVARAHQLRRWDPYFRNIALWSYFRGGKRFRGDIEGNIISATFDEGWIWIIPLKDDVYSVGVVTGVESSDDVQRLGTQAFYEQCIGECETAAEILARAEQIDEVRTIKEWSYDAEALSLERAFLCGDAACFVDPLFSQGVHLATYSGMLAAAAIDHLLTHPEDDAAVRRWYESSYRAAYGRYHKFLCAFYAHNEQPDSRFWSSRNLTSLADERLRGADWLLALTGEDGDAATSGPDGIGRLKEGANLLATLWRHSASDLGEGLNENELTLRRLQWANGLVRDLKRQKAIRWTGSDVMTVESFRVGRESFRLERLTYLADREGRTLTAYPVTDEQCKFLAGLITEPLHYNALASRLGKMGGHVAPLQMILRLLEDGLLEALDDKGKPYRMAQVLRFAGVGGDDDFS